MPIDIRRGWIDRSDQDITLTDQLSLSRVSRAAYYYKPVFETPDNLFYMDLIDHEYMAHPFYGSRKMTAVLNRMGYRVNRKRVTRLMRQMGLQAIYPKFNTSRPCRENRTYPYLLNGLKISFPDHVWGSDITYIPVRGGFLYLVAIMDWYTRYVLAWRLSNTLDMSFCLEALEEAFHISKPEIFNSDQGSQYTSNEFTGALESHGVRISMDGKGRAFDNIFVERLWRSIKYEEVYIKKYETGLEAHQGLKEYLRFYNAERPHQALGYKTPEAMYCL